MQEASVLAPLGISGYLFRNRGANVIFFAFFSLPLRAVKMGCASTLLKQRNEDASVSVSHRERDAAKPWTSNDRGRPLRIDRPASPKGKNDKNIPECSLTVKSKGNSHD